MLGTKPGSSGRIGSALNHQAVLLASGHLFQERSFGVLTACCHGSMSPMRMQQSGCLESCGVFVGREVGS